MSTADGDTSIRPPFIDLVCFSEASISFWFPQKYEVILYANMFKCARRSYATNGFGVLRELLVADPALAHRGLSVFFSMKSSPFTTLSFRLLSFHLTYSGNET